MRMLASCLCALLLIAGLPSLLFGDTPKQYTVMTYNVLYGAGVDAKEEQIANRWSSGKYHGNRLERVISVIKSVNPDIVGIQEACSWDKDSESAAKQVAKELGMNYFVGKSGRSRFNVALFSRFPIVTAKGFPSDFSRAALQAEIKLPDGRPLYAFVGHFNPWDAGQKLQEIQFLAQQMKLYADDLGVLMVDANMAYREGKDTTDALRASGFLIAPFVKGIDQIWTSRPLSGSFKAGPNIPSDLTTGVSDHRPTVVVISIPPLEETEDTPSPAP